jgi:hypothetical protein
MRSMIAPKTELTHHTSSRHVKENGLILGDVCNVKLLDEDALRWLAIRYRRCDYGRSRAPSVVVQMAG